MNRTGEIRTVSSKGEIVPTARPTKRELDLHLFMLAVSVWHETQHVVTDAFLNPFHHVPCEPTVSVASGIQSPVRNADHAAHAQKRGTPPHIGTCTFKGREAGDSGFALEEIIFGGRVMHTDDGIFPFKVLVFY
jgi:hypothetical protein